MEVDFPGSEIGCFEPGNVFQDYCFLLRLKCQVEEKTRNGI